MVLRERSRGCHLTLDPDQQEDASLGIKANAPVLGNAFQGGSGVRQISQVFSTSRLNPAWSGRYLDLAPPVRTSRNLRKKTIGRRNRAGAARPIRERQSNANI